MADKSDIYVKVPDGSYIKFPAGTSPQVMSMAVRSQLGAVANRPGMPATHPVEMKESLAPKIVRGAASSLPVVGGVAGGIAGAPAAGVGAPIGAGAGAALGEVGREQINESVFGDKRMTGKESAKDIALAGGTAAALEGAGGAAIGLGRRVIGRIGLARSAKEAGDIIEGLVREHPVGFTPKSMMASLQRAYNEASSGLGRVFRGSPATSSVDDALQNSYQASRSANASVRGVSGRFDRIISAARLNAGITRGGAHGYQATAEEMFNFQKQLAREAYTGNPGPVSEVLKKLLRVAYEDVGKTLRQVSPEADPALTRLTNIHAAQGALKRYGASKMESTMATAALHPRTTAAISPAVTAAGVAGYGKAKDMFGNMVRTTVP